MKQSLKRLVTAFTLGALFWASFIYLPPFYFTCILIGILIQIIMFEWVNFFDIHKLGYWVIMPIYPILPFALIIALNHSPEYRHLLFALFIIVSSLDTGSYIFGQLFGRHKLAPHISPGKTWEGFFGGYFSACIGLGILTYELKTPIPLWFLLSFTFVICSLALTGDLFESFLKRRAGIKDSGDILPGHGGFLDRFDGILFAVVFFYIFKDQLAVIFQ